MSAVHQSESAGKPRRSYFATGLYFVTKAKVGAYRAKAGVVANVQERVKVKVLESVLIAKAQSEGLEYVSSSFAWE